MPSWKRASVALAGFIVVLSISSLAIGAVPSGASGPPDVVGLEVTSGPQGIVDKHFATFRFTANPDAYGFKCKLDGRPQRPCTSPITFRHLKSGTHYLQISASVREEDGGEGAVELLRWTIR